MHYIHLILHLKSAHVRLSSYNHTAEIKHPGLRDILRKVLWSNTVLLKVEFSFPILTFICYKLGVYAISIDLAHCIKFEKISGAVLAN